MHFQADLVHIFLSVLNHLQRFVPLLLERGLCAFNFASLNLHPSLYLSLAILVGLWIDLVFLKLLLQMLAFLLLSECEALFSELDQTFELVVLQHVVKFLLGILLEGVAFKN